MRKIIESTFVTLNGSISNPQDWSGPYWDEDHFGYSGKLLETTEALLLGRRTYEGFAEAWSQRDGEMADTFNNMPKYVASRTLTGPLEWNATLIEGEVVQAVAALKEKHAGNLIISGCGELANTLAQQGQVDEFWFWVNPHVWPAGPRILDGVGPIRLQLVAATPYRSGVVWLRYRPAA